ncbi:acyl-CoA dehydrogenase family protein [Salipiger marinus]|uniref:acyl-CoA dehydrogenase family protein n=1 Tax=Salipiger marinus TaxID=555512 RepID=UPI001E535D4E|nr:acyl-CoA dehydrogenase family protein [Salipiger manganoxidans]MCD1618989.1 acyl-CoA dehydrogenase family protein [Salipiger manganoxidans]MEB3420105.1 acyl-CoA dehydrogenase family protein [Salipiger manganoxidans]
MTPDYTAMSDAEFRALIRDFVETEYPDIPRFPLERLHWDVVKPWYLKLSQRGFLCPTWPVDRGGMGLTAAKHLIMVEELERFGAARVHDIGPVMLGPLLLKYGTEAQKDHFLPRILSGEHVWAQGYSEPGAGSDLAAVRCEAVQQGGDWVINGQKTWTTLGMDANWIFILARTDKTVKKQAGISFLLVPMDAPGVSTRNILNLSGEAEFCEVFFDDVRVPLDHIVGEVNQGWTAAKALLGHERVFIGAPRLSASALARLEHLARHMGQWSDPVFRDRFVALRCDVLDLGDLFQTYLDRLRDGTEIGADVAMLKVFQSELYQRISDLTMEVAGPASGLRHPPQGDRRLHAAATYLSARPVTIFGGSTEILRNVLARAVLGLPG